ncbi:MAG: lipoprotein [Betaproteobacteria bacterium]|jgi:predicted small lipoprotein YifL|nr:lipoprotein [Betaproteobacteria bacterium]MBK7655363.1 lipoprotein [Betaproteobacteria bacterium]MBP7779994.1 lipoprotein [Burkholderiaceae bacterium]
MLNNWQILFCALVLTLMGLSACGQKGNLYHPTDPAAAGRASLPQAIGTSIRSIIPAPAASGVQGKP